MPTPASRRTGISRPRSRRRIATLALCATALAPVVLAGCAAGQVAETAAIAPAIGGTDLDLRVPTGVISIRNASIDYPGTDPYHVGGSAPMSLRIINGTTAPIHLRAVVATASAGTGSAGKVVVLREPTPSASPSHSPSARVEASAHAGIGSAASPGHGLAATHSPNTSASVSPAQSPSPTAAAGDTTIDIEIPAAPNGLIVLSESAGTGPYLAISELTQDIQVQDQVRLALVFTLADGSVVSLGGGNSAGDRLLVPVATPASAGPRSPLPLAPTS